MKAIIVFDTLVGVSLVTELTSLREIFVVRQGHHSLLFYPTPLLTIKTGISHFAVSHCQLHCDSGVDVSNYIVSAVS